MSQLNERIRIIRKRAGLSQKQFAMRLGVNQGHISKIETGAANPSKGLILNICICFKISLEWINKGNGPIQAEWSLEELKRLTKPGAFQITPESFLLLHEGIAEGIEQFEIYDKIFRCLGDDIFQLTEPSIKPGDLAVIEIVESILNKLQFKALRKPGGAKLLSSMFPEDLTGVDKSVISLLRCIDSNSLKDFYLFLASKADRLDEKQREKLKRDIAILKKASK